MESPPGRDGHSGDPPIERITRLLLVAGGVVGLVAAFVLSIERIKLAEDPGYVPSCSFNPVLSCGAVMESEQAAAFGFPNPLIGIAGFAAVAALGIALLAGARFPRWLWLAIQAGVLFAVVFVHWLFFQSVYEIGALCPYCIVVWLVTIPIFFYVTLRNALAGDLPLPTSARRAVGAVARYHGVVITVWLLALTALVGESFWYYWQTLL